MTDDMVKKLTSLAQLDRDATSVYNEALKHVTNEDVKTTLTDFRDEHENHVTKLSEAVANAGGPRLALTVDTMGHLADWFTAFRAMGGEHGALKALHSAEKYHNSRYAEAAGWDVGDDELKDTLSRFYNEEKRHLSWVDSKLSVSAPSAG